ncbi:hypothetical protein N7450_008306 [Penicillium hetheringtonii]|uniref:Uncharacterized protein n=1 Tax=Penicillium hetheringtonii TaxID=911720 RepID=A0AAD6GPT1_9EURO|nr:hypothetical protein N7450_008306 [Penicillium hetheringtonii]
MKFLWTSLCIVGAIASAIPYTSAHEVHLPYLPSLEPENPTNTYLSIKWTIKDGSLYANNDQIFPPVMSMQMHAPLYDSDHKVALQEEDIHLYYSLNARPIPASDIGALHDILRINVELIDKEGRPVTPMLWLLICSIPPMELIPWQMKFWKTQVNTLLNHHQPELSSSSTSSPQSSTPKLQSTQNKGTTKSSSNHQPESTSTPENESQVGYMFSPYGSTYIVSNNGGHHRGHHHPHHHHGQDSFMRLVRPVILPAMMGIGAGLLACLVGFCVGHLVISLATRLGFYKRGSQNRDSRSSLACLEEGNHSEKAHLMIPEIHLTEPDV